MLADLVAVHCVLRGAGGDGDGVWLATALALAVQLLSVPTGKQEQVNNNKQTDTMATWQGDQETVLICYV